ncbi:MAG: Dihydrofolate reductase [Microgenomates group bacterium GW2011_GWA2_37_6]|nr:MAG: Dihydrofolate reductase [Microgenomates group bacterium GW2011_GWA2_37_6]
MISIVAAIDEKRGLGKNNDLLFRIPQDFKRMQKLTKGHSIIMGRRTFESVGRVLPDRTNIVISRNPSLSDISIYHASNLIFCSSLEEALRQAQGKPGAEEIFIFGGGQVFKEVIEKNLVDCLYLTIVEGDYGADTFFPDYSMFRIIKEEQGSDSNYKFNFLTLQK